MKHTNLARAAVRERVNLEVDVIGKYVVRVAELAGLTPAGAPRGEATR
jgi:riboflavin synthase alpha subunit